MTRSSPSSSTTGHAYVVEGQGVYFQVDTLRRVRHALAPHARRAARERGRARRRRRAQACSRRLRALEDGQARRAGVGLAVGSGPAGLAHRVLGDVVEAPRRRLRHPRRRQRSRVPAPRERDRASRRRRPRVRALLVAQRDAERRRREDVEVARQLRDARRRARPATTRARSGCSFCRRTTARRWRSATRSSSDAEKAVGRLDALARRARADGLAGGAGRRRRSVPRRDGRRLRHAGRARVRLRARARRERRARRGPARDGGDLLRRRCSELVGRARYRAASRRARGRRGDRRARARRARRLAPPRTGPRPTASATS